MDNNYNASLENLITNGYKVDIEKYIENGIALFKIGANTVVPFSLILIIVTAITSRVPFLPPVISLLVMPCVTAGYFFVANRIIQGKSVSMSNYFEGFNIFIELVVLNLLINVFETIGLFFLILPGIYLLVSYKFAMMFVIFLKMDFRSAMKYSRRIIHVNWWKMFLLFIVSLLIGLSGVLFCGVGIIITLPIMYCINYSAFEDIVGNAIRNDAQNFNSENDL